MPPDEFPSVLDKALYTSRITPLLKLTFKVWIDVLRLQPNGQPSDKTGSNQLDEASGATKQQIRMTLCGSEVPQDRWRGRTAGSGMWTLTRDNLLSWSLDDPAIPYG